MERPAEITIRIDRLLLEGFMRLDGDRVRQAVQSELTRLVAERGLPGDMSRLSARAAVDAGALEPGPAGEPEIGARIAQRIYEGFSG